MYIATVPNRNSPPAILIRESYRENGKVKNRTLANLSDWHPARIEALRRALRGSSITPPFRSHPRSRLWSAVCLHQIADALGITAALGNTDSRQAGLVRRLGASGPSGLSLVGGTLGRGSRSREVLGFSPFDEDDLYAALDDLCARQEKIERALYRRYRRRRVQPRPVSLRRHQQLFGGRVQRTGRVWLQPRRQARQAANRHRPADRR